MAVRACFVLIVALPVCIAQTQDKSKSYTLSPQEIADGWLLLFDGETPFGWRPERGEAKAENGELVLGGKQETVVVLELGYFDLEWQWRWKGNTAPHRKVDAWAPNGSKAIAEGDFDFADRNGTPAWFSERWSIHADPQGLAKNDKNVSVEQGEPKIETNTRFGPDRQIRVTLTVPVGTWLAIKNAKVKPHGLKSIFNAKDLTGWKEHAGRKSKYTVNERGELNVKDGPGDLQTEEEWDDFMLQLDCISNGKHLNSGIFFRCIPGQYQQGYEAQIRNQWEGDDRTKPVDFGTGAIYRRQPARKVVSSDGEWFTMTVLARGNRLMTWVNGYPVADFVDTRPPHENARSGTKLGKGAISIQGHDPTTDLSFRNIRIAPLVRANP